ncbi:MAG: efflux RND transporter periplasmic adaptor subunit [Verrucomicrobiales bacterium]|jgi:membrane fusion protein (multidrug efflux system)|nr:efflux RND transporter periplasmic adaptor subunit [Verrucomicrobiales bacterium]
MMKITPNLFFITACCAILAAGCEKQEKVAPPPPVVLVSEAQQQNVPIYEESIATLDGSTNTNIRAQVSGYLVSQNYIEGSTVKKGQLLFQIDPRTYQATLDRAQAELASAQAQQLQAQQTEDRNRQMYAQDAVSKKNLDNSVQANEAAKAQVMAAKAEVETAKLNLNYTKVISPIDGVIGKAIPSLGDLISPAQELSTVSTINPIRANFTVSEQFYLLHAEKIVESSKLPLEQRPDRLEIILANGDIYSHKGKFDYINRQVDTSTGTFLVTGLFPNPQSILRPGQYARLRAVVKNIPDAIVVPQRAVSEMQGIYQIVVIKDDGTVDLRKVTVGPQVGSVWVIMNGLKAGEKVVVEGIQKCVPGAKVIARPFEAPKTAANSETAQNKE